MKTDYDTIFKQFTGSWRLIASEFRTSGGEVIHPLGDDALGRVIFSRSGFMSAQLMRKGRPGFASEDPSNGTFEEIKSAFEGYIAYYGPFELDLEKQRLITHVEGSLFPNWVGADQVRFFEFNGDRLTLKTPPFAFGDEKFQGVLVWERE
ncbi:MAG: lipocalin-like domain-containing protein [Desulfobacterales bacterium]